MSEFLDTWNALSSGDDSIFASNIHDLLDILGNAGTWAGAAAKLIGLIS